MQSETRVYSHIYFEVNVMAKKYAFLFPGQGAQAPGMIKDVADAFPAAKKL